MLHSPPNFHTKNSQPSYALAANRVASNNNSNKKKLKTISCDVMDTISLIIPKTHAGRFMGSQQIGIPGTEQGVVLRSLQQSSRPTKDFEAG